MGAEPVLAPAQALLANIAAMYAVYHGPDGLNRIAQRVNGLAAVLATGVSWACVPAQALPLTPVQTNKSPEVRSTGVLMLFNACSGPQSMSPMLACTLQHGLIFQILLCRATCAPWSFLQMLACNLLTPSLACPQARPSWATRWARRRSSTRCASRSAMRRQSCLSGGGRPRRQSAPAGRLHHHGGLR